MFSEVIDAGCVGQQARRRATDRTRPSLVADQRRGAEVKPPRSKVQLPELRDRARASLWPKSEMLAPREGTADERDRVPQRVWAAGKGNFYHAHRRSLWAENHAIDLINQDCSLRAVKFGASYAEPDFPHLTQAEFDALVAATDTLGKRPDLLIFSAEDYQILRALYPLRSDPSKPLIDNLMLASDAELLDAPEIMARALKGVEVKQSNHQVARCADYGIPSSSSVPRKNLDAYIGIAFAQSAKIPRVFLDVDEFRRLQEWRDRFDVPLLVAQFCLDASFLLDFRMLERAVKDKVIRKVLKTSGRPPKGRVKSSALEYRFWYSLGCIFGIQTKETVFIPIAQVQESGPWGTTSVVASGDWFLHSDGAWLLHV